MHEPILPQAERIKLLDALYQKYGVKQGFWQRLFYLRKKYTWIIFVKGAKGLKRFLDIVISAFCLVVFSPVFILIASIIKLTDPGPVLYVSRRVGQWGKEFIFYKFRTMHVNADKQKEAISSLNDFTNSKTFKMKTDPRISKFGRILRKTSLDELPQLWSVLIGDMSLVGPRPPIPSEVAQYNLEDRRRLDVKPGITCIWQVSGRSQLSFDKQVKLDIEYIESRSLLLDIKLLFKTVPAVLFGKGAY